MLITYYRIVGGDEEYIGSTKNRLGQRWSEHKWDFKNGRNKANSGMLFKKYGIDGCRIEVIECGEYATREQSRLREAELIVSSPKCVNKHIPGRTQEQWEDDNREHRRITQHECYLRRSNKLVLHHLADASVR